MAETTFGSDNHAGMAPEVLAALGEANVGHASGYGDDAWTERAEARLHDAFGNYWRRAGIEVDDPPRPLVVVIWPLKVRPGKAVLVAVTDWPGRTRP